MSFDPAALLAVHARLLTGDPTASADLFELVYGPLIGHAMKKHAAFGMHEDRARDLAVGVLASLVERPDIFDPQRGNLFGFLCMMLDGDAKNAGRNDANRNEEFSEFTVEVEKIGIIRTTQTENRELRCDPPPHLAPDYVTRSMRQRARLDRH
jgi:hypothetical protein